MSRLTKTHSKSSVSATLSLHPLHIGRGLGEGGCLFGFVSLRQRNEHILLLLFKKKSTDLLILIHPPILFNERQKPFEHLYSLRLQLSGIQKFPLMLNPVQHIMLFYPVFRRIPVVLIVDGNPKHIYIAQKYQSFCFSLNRSQMSDE